MNLQTLLKRATSRLTEISSTPRLDAEIMLAHILGKRRSYLYARGEEELSEAQQQLFNKLVERRYSGEPIAYLLGRKEFWSLEFKVNRHTLIPRPETERLVEIILAEYGDHPTLVVADLGTGSGAIAISLAHARPNWKFVATDCSTEALKIAEENARNLAVKNISFVCGNWCDALPTQKFDVIVSNPPYIAAAERHLTKNIDFEPEGALFSAENGLDDLRAIIVSAKQYLKSNGSLVLEHGFNQSKEVKQMLIEHGYEVIINERGASCAKRSF